MKKHYKSFFLIFLVVIGTASVLFLKAETTGWMRLSQDYLRVLKSRDGQILLYNALQESDLVAISGSDKIRFDENGLEIINSAKESNVALNDKRPVSIKPWNVQELTAQTKQISDINSISEFSFLYEDIDGKKEGRIKKIDVGSSSILAVSDPELESINFVPSPDGQKGIVWTSLGIWEISSEKESSRRLTEERYSGYSYGDLLEKQKISVTDSEIEPFIWWNDYPSFNPDGSKLVYTSNRDVSSWKGNSIWYYDYSTKKEYLLLKNKMGEYYNIAGWLDNQHIICKKSLDNKKEFIVINLDGKMSDLGISGDDIEIMNISSNGYIAYTPDYSLSNELVIIDIITTGGIQEIYRCSFDGIIQNISSLPAGFSPDNEMYALVLSPKDSALNHQISIIDLKDGIARRIDNIITGIASPQRFLYGIDWINESELLGYVWENGDKTTWIYSIKQGGE